MKKNLIALFSVAVLAAATSLAHADTITYTEPQASPSGECCFQVTLTTVSSTDISVDVTLLDGATFFANTGSGNHPTFAFNLSGVSGVSLTNIPSGWTGSTSPVTQTSPDFGTYTDQVNLTGSSGTSGKVSELTFDVTVASGSINFANFVKNADGYFFVADFLGSNGGTGLGSIKDPGTPGGGQTPEPSSLMLLGTGIVGAAGLVRRRLATRA